MSYCQRCADYEAQLVTMTESRDFHKARGDKWVAAFERVSND
jgi:hypothetical protein